MAQEKQNMEGRVLDEIAYWALNKKDPGRTCPASPPASVLQTHVCTHDHSHGQATVNWLAVAAVLTAQHPPLRVLARIGSRGS